VRDIFDVHARAFYRELALLDGDNPSWLRLGYVKVGDAVLATFSGTVCRRRMTFVCLRSPTATAAIPLARFCQA
jgi:hypothetical protein